MYKGWLGWLDGMKSTQILRFPDYTVCTFRNDEPRKYNFWILKERRTTGLLYRLEHHDSIGRDIVCEGNDYYKILWDFYRQVYTWTYFVFVKVTGENPLNLPEEEWPFVSRRGNAKNVSH